MDQGGLGVERIEHPQVHRRWSLSGGNSGSQKTQTSDVALQSPKAFHCIPLYHFSIWGLPHWSMPVEGALQSDQGLWESTGAFIADSLRFGRSRVGGRRLFDRKRTAEAMTTCTQFQMSVFLFRKKKTKTKDVYIYDCYNFNWYILLNGNHNDRIPQWHILSHIHRHEILGMLRFTLACLSVRQTDVTLYL